MERWTPAHHRAPGSRCCPHRIPQSLSRSHHHSPSPLLCEDTGMKEPSTEQCVEGGASLCPPTGHAYANVSSLFPQTQDMLLVVVCGERPRNRGSLCLHVLSYTSISLQKSYPLIGPRNPDDAHGLLLSVKGQFSSLHQASSCRRRAGAVPATGHLETA